MLVEDPSRSAYRGYREATSGRGAGHLAWERIGGRFAAARQRALEHGRNFDDHRMAYVMGYGLGLRDINGIEPRDVGADDMDVILPWLSSARPVYNSPRFWMSVSG